MTERFLSFVVLWLTLVVGFLAAWLAVDALEIKRKISLSLKVRDFKV